MWVLGILGGILALLVGYSVLVARRFSFPETYEPRPAPLEKLPPEDAERIDAWGRALEAAGWRRIGDFQVDLDLGRPGGITQVEQKRVWLSADRTIWAAAKRFSILNPAMEGVARAWRMLGFTSRLPSGALLSTHNCPAVDSSFLRDPESSSRVYPGLEDLDLLLEAHRRHLKERAAAPETSDGDLVALERAAWRRTSEQGEAQGYLMRRDGRFHSTLKLALRSSLQGLNPLRLESGTRSGPVLRLAGMAAGSAGAALLISENAAPPWTIALLFAATAAASCAVFPRSHLISWIAAMLPAHLLLHFRASAPEWGWIAGAATVALILPRLEAARYRRAAAALARPDAGPPPRTRPARLAWAGAFAASVLIGAALLVWIRAPKQTQPFSLLVATLGALATSGVLVASVGAGLVRSLRRSPVKRTLDDLSVCALLILAGFVGGAGFAWQDEKASRAAVDQVLARLEAFRAERGTYPAALAELGELPAPRCGWRPCAFTYAGPPAFGRPDWFTLSWPTARGPSFAVPPATP